MKNYNLILLSFLLITCGCGRSLNLETPARKPIKVNDNISALSVDVKEFYSKATTFSMFWIPKEKELTWKTSLYKSTDSYEDKVAAIMSNIIKNSDEFDLYDQKIIDMIKVKEPLTKKYEELECDFDYTDECAQIDEKLKEITAKSSVKSKLPDGTLKDVDFEGYKSHLIEEIQSSVDHYDRVNPDLNRPKNWMLYGDAPLYEIRQDDKKIHITFPNLGPFGSQNHYSTDSKEIFDVKFVPSEYNDRIELLKFKIKEKNSKGKFTGLIWEYTLERSFSVGKLRYKGDVLKVDAQGQVLRRGVCKIDFAKKGT